MKLDIWGYIWASYQCYLDNLSIHMLLRQFELPTWDDPQHLVLDSRKKYVLAFPYHWSFLSWNINVWAFLVLHPSNPSLGLPRSSFEMLRCSVASQVTLRQSWVPFFPGKRFSRFMEIQGNTSEMSWIWEKYRTFLWFLMFIIF